jgi:NADH-quinone oxidoreductase subunit N
VFGAALQADLIWLAIVGAVTSVISAYFYLRVVYLAFMYDGEGELTLWPEIKLVVALAVVIVLLLGVLPGPWFELARDAAISSVQVLAGG